MIHTYSWIQWTHLTVNYVGRTVVRSDGFHCCIIETKEKVHNRALDFIDAREEP